jgi:MFS family permease
MTLRHNPRFARFWLASTVSDFGTYLTTVALSVMILVTLDGSAFDQGLVNAARWAPYLLFGLVAGIWVDRFERSTVLITGDVARGALLVILCLAAWLDVLAVPALMAIIFAFGTVALLSDAASQSFLPMLVPRAQLTRANARLQQSTAVAQTSGAALAVESASATLRGRIAEGLRWVYRHVHLGPLALSTHVWFIGFSMVGAIVPALVILELDLGAFGLGLVLGGAGIGGVTGTLASTRLGGRFGTGRTIVTARLAEPFGVALMALAPAVLIALDGNIPSGVDRGGVADWPVGAWAALGVAFLGQLIIGAAMGAEGPLQMGFEQAVTPDRLIARMSATRRSINRGMIVVGAPLGGFLATNAGVQTALWASVAVMVFAGLILAMSPFRSARIELHQLSDEDARTR